MSELHVKSSQQKDVKSKPIPQQSNSKLIFKYTPSRDGVDTNLLILIHGLGDTLRPFASLGEKLHLPQTATLAVQAPELVPYMDGESYQWFPSFHLLSGEVLPFGHPEQRKGLLQTRKLLTDLIQHVIEYCHYRAPHIFLFGFSQGGTVAVDQVLEGDIRNLGGVISISGYPMAAANRSNSIPYDGPILITQGDKDQMIGVNLAKELFEQVKQRCTSTAQIQQLFIPGKGHSMPSSEQEWRSVHSFLSNHMPRRNLQLENMSDIYEIQPGSSI